MKNLPYGLIVVLGLAVIVLLCLMPKPKTTTVFIKGKSDTLTFWDTLTKRDTVTKFIKGKDIHTWDTVFVADSSWDSSGDEVTDTVRDSMFCYAFKVDTLMAQIGVSLCIPESKKLPLSALRFGLTYIPPPTKVEQIKQTDTLKEKEKSSGALDIFIGIASFILGMFLGVHL